jgi:glycosyltransferase involved in cell wall biosynthesis
VVPTYERPESLERLLDALAAQTLSTDEFEVIVCDDATSDETRHQIERWRDGRGVSIRYLRGSTPRQGTAAMRNAGWRAARGEVVAFTNDDTIPDRDWLRQGLLALADDAADAASGRIDVAASEHSTDSEHATAGLDGGGFASANCFCRRAVLAAVGGFDPRFRTSWREDSDLFFELITRGLDVVHASDAVVVQPVRPAPWHVRLGAERRYVYDALLYKKHPGLYEQFIGPGRPYLYYGILLAAAIAAIGTISDAPVAAMAGLAGWCVLTSAVVARRLRETQGSARRIAEVVATSLVVPIVAVYWRVRGGVAYRVGFW